MNKHKSLLKFCLIIVLSGVGGALLGVGIIQLEMNNLLRGITDQFAAFFTDYSFETMVVLSVGLLLISWFFYFYSKRLYQNYQEDDETLFRRIDYNLAIALMLSNVGMIVLFMFFGICISFGDDILGGAIFMIAWSLFITYAQAVFVGFTKILYPEKEGDILDTNFNKKWLGSCDEAEKYTMYQSAYRTFTIMKVVFVVAMTCLMLLALFFDIGILPFVLVGLLWGIESITYMVFSMKSGQAC